MKKFISRLRSWFTIHVSYPAYDAYLDWKFCLWQLFLPVRRLIGFCYYMLFFFFLSVAYFFKGYGFQCISIAAAHMAQIVEEDKQKENDKFLEVTQKLTDSLEELAEDFGKDGNENEANELRQQVESIRKCLRKMK